MSLYPQSQPYAQVSYHAAPAYSQPYPQPNMYSPPPPPMPPVVLDPNSFRRHYTQRLAELTVNSRPVIQNLSMIAQDYSRYCEIVAQCLEEHIRRVPQWMKLPAFYLLDAISKNIYDPYARQFTPVIVKLFLDTYNEVNDPSTRSKMEEMLLTWRTGSPHGRELFGVGPQVAIERQIWGGGQSNQNGAPSISTAQVLSELEFVLGQKERALQNNPYDKNAQNHVAVLQQLRKLVQTGVSQPELQQILNQLRTLAPPPPVAHAHPPPPVPQTYPVASAFPSAPAPPPPQPSYPVATAQGPYPVPQSYVAQSYVQPKPEPTNMSSIPPASTSSAPATAATNFSNLFSALQKAGLVSAGGTPTGAGATAKESTPPPMPPSKDDRREYRKAILSNRIRLTSNDIIKQRPPIQHFLYERLPGQCRQCGVRFTDGVSGKKQMEDHLDMHFRQNRKANQSTGRGHSRGWFVTVEDWILDGSIDAKGKGRADGVAQVKAAAAAEAAKQEADLRAMYVVVPPGDEAKTISCPICKEALKAEFLEDDEEWVWRNAVKKDDKIYHATCHAEAAASKSSLAARLRNEVSSRSRSRTPEAAGYPSPSKSESPSPSKVAGLKRKAEDDDDSAPFVKREDEDTPPSKKLALSSS
ncbi:hypothetical protein K474DRAFT_1688442 [Panus rudis PR-1116 ss-1]|nr:hypothetical protein K474DRAFT_1688442 [Panus rudis PR-1116 ss-1]